MARKKTAKSRTKHWTWKTWLKGLVLTLVMVIVVGAVWLCIDFDYRHKGQPYQLGVSFSPRYAKELGVDPHDTLTALINEVGVRRFRLMTYWDDGEPQPGKYDFSQFDWQVNQVAAAGGKVSLAVGMRQPRWPECFVPDWAQNISQADREKDLDNYIAAVVDHYKGNPAISEYQLENEALLGVFGVCKPFNINRRQLQDELNFIHAHDDSHPVVMTVSNEYGLPLGAPHADESAFSVYRRVWSVFHTYADYLFPSWWFKARADMIERWLGMPVFIHELQAEPWGPTGTVYLSLDEQNKSMDAARLQKSVDYAKSTGIRTIDLWGGEWWYWRKVHFHDNTVWDTAHHIFTTQN